MDYLAMFKKYQEQVEDSGEDYCPSEPSEQNYYGEENYSCGEDYNPSESQYYHYEAYESEEVGQNVPELSATPDKEGPQVSDYLKQFRQYQQQYNVDFSGSSEDYEDEEQSAAGEEKPNVVPQPIELKPLLRPRASFSPKVRAPQSPPAWLVPKNSQNAQTSQTSQASQTTQTPQVPQIQTSQATTWRTSQTPKTPSSQAPKATHTFLSKNAPPPSRPASRAPEQKVGSPVRPSHLSFQPQRPKADSVPRRPRSESNHPAQQPLVPSPFSRTNQFQGGDKPVKETLKSMKILSEKDENHAQIAMNGQGLLFLSSVLSTTRDLESETYTLEILANLSQNDDICPFLLQPEVIAAVMKYLNSDNEKLVELTNTIMRNTEHQYKHRNRTPSKAQRELQSSRRLKATDVWTPDDFTDECMCCSKKFSKIHRRHHCRLCGGLYCGTCTSTRLLVEISEGKWSKERVCLKCIQAYTKGAEPTLPEIKI
eukprot:TRINITY_DN16727_c0_g1_i1.p1 TRINITY_DN16727_c0_g1~~TRINITY_DN16727_c0_g1_i1.p1  ORF type:complete len:507 (+),score=100.04 TRINITY_DN16727_c0_g1_i1:77-1522(+)